MQVFTLVSALPVYLPYDSAVVPFGDPFNDVTITSSTTAVVTVPGYTPVAGQIVGFTATSGNTIASGINGYAPAGYSSSGAGGSASGLYYIVAPISGNTFAVSATKGGSAVATTTSNSASGQVVIHLLSLQVDGTLRPFKPGATVVAMNIGATNVTLQGASDVNELGPGQVYPSGKNPPGGPGVYSTLATVNSGTAALVVLQADWINASGGSLILLQN
jgi:hypothetical protein